MLGSILDEDHAGSTRLHLDLSDAVNILTYASKTPEGLPGYALWHIFAPEDSVRIRAYLRQHSQKCNNAVGDPIHNQQTYLTPRMLCDLKDHHSVRPYTIRQYVGDAVFIPAGCAHQVLTSFILRPLLCNKCSRSRTRPTASRSLATSLVPNL